MTTQELALALDIMVTVLAVIIGGGTIAGFWLLRVEG